MSQDQPALRAVLQFIVDRLHHHHDFTDFALGALIGAGIGLTLIGASRNRSRPAT